MPHLLQDLPDGTTCFLDATIFYYHLVNTPPLSDDCSDLLARIGAGALSGVTSTVALAEATHKVMLAEVVRQQGVTPQGLIARLKKHPEWLDNLIEHQQVVALAQALQITIEPITPHFAATGCGTVAATTVVDQRCTNVGGAGKVGRPASSHKRS